MNRLFVMLLMIGFGGCIASHQSVVVDVDVDGWSDRAGVEVINTDTVTPRNIEIFARYSPSLVDDSMRLIINTIAPDSTSYDEEVTIYLNTRMLERGASRIDRYPYRHNVVWRQMGSYKIEMTPAAEIVGVEAIGLNIGATEDSPAERTTTQP